MNISIHNVKAIAGHAKVLAVPAGYGQDAFTSHLVTIDVMAKNERHSLTLYVPTQDMADALANAINYANASASVQTHHDRRLGDAGIQEYRDLIVALPEGV
jgi:hypothetical protein